MNRERLDRWCERGILALVVAILVYGPLGLGAVRGLEFGIIQELTVAVMILWAARLWLNPRPQLFWPPICWAVLAFTGYAIARYFTADIEYVARQELTQLLVYAFLFLSVLNNLQRQESVLVIALSLVFVAMSIAIYAIYQFAAFHKFPDAPHYVWHFPALYPGRGSGTYICPNHLGGFLEMLLPLALAYTLTGRLRSTTKVFLGYAALVILGGIVISLSRGSWLSTAVALALLFAILLLRRYDRLPAAALLLVTVCLTAAILPRMSTLQKRLEEVQPDSITRDFRPAVWAPAYRMWQEHSWWGVGPGHFDARFRAYRPEGVQVKPDRVHNDYLNTLVDWGIAGTAFVVAAWVLFGWGLVRSWRLVARMPELGGVTRSNRFAFMLGGSVGLAAILVHSAVDFNFHIPANAILAVTLLALLTGYLRYVSERFWFRSGPTIRVLVSAVIAGGSIYLIQQGWRQSTEFVWLQRAGESLLYSPQQIECLQHAWAIDPKNPETALALGEAFRQESQEGGASYQGQEGIDYQVLAQRAMEWYQRGMKLNPWDCRNYSGYGWCLDWLDRSAESAPWFARAEELDPNNYFNILCIAMHYVQLGDFAAAKPWLERSRRLDWHHNIIASNYAAIVDQRLAEAATNAVFAPMIFQSH